MPHCTGDLISGNENLNRPQTLGSPNVRFDSLHASSTAEVDLAFAKLGREPGSALIAAIPTSSLCVELPANPAFGIKGAYFVDDPLSKMHTHGAGPCGPFRSSCGWNIFSFCSLARRATRPRPLRDPTRQRIILLRPRSAHQRG